MVSTRCRRSVNVQCSASAKKEVEGSGFSELEEMAIIAGAKVCQQLLPKKGTEKLPSTLIIGTQENVDPPALESWKIIAQGIMSLGVLRGCLDAEGEEFIIRKTEQGKGNNKKRKR